MKLAFRYDDDICHTDSSGKRWLGRFIQYVGYDNAVVWFDRAFQPQAVHLSTLLFRRG